ncbi:MAG TPA: hypothetical protein VH374_02495 [Polyangia bacterium]|nr:hypothetical protein [Polyangia bacterium]
MAAPAPPARPSGSAPGTPASPEAGRLVDLYIVGGESPDPNVQLKLATLIASRYRVAAPAVADGLSGGACLVGTRLADSAAKKLSDELRDLGAISKIQPAGVPLRLTIKRTLDSEGRIIGGTNPESFDHVSSVSSPMQLVEMGERIETAVRKAPSAVTKPKTGPEIVRCPIHGLNYDRTKASGCMRCLQPARDVARAIEERQAGWGDVRSNPVKRAAAGLAVAVLVGLLPAAYYARGINGAEVKSLRARQAELSEQLGTKAVTDEYDSLDASIDQVRSRGLRRTMALWIVVSGVVGVAWSRLAGPRDASD